MICHIDCSNLSDAKQLHRELARFLDFPDWYGQNLDALFDCLTELSSPTQVYLSSWDHNNAWAAGFESVLTDAQESCPDLAVVFD